MTIRPVSIEGVWTPSVKIAEAILPAPFDAKTRFSQKIVGRANTRRVQGAQETNSYYIYVDIEAQRFLSPLKGEVDANVVSRRRGV